MPSEQAIGAAPESGFIAAPAGWVGTVGYPIIYTAKRAGLALHEIGALLRGPQGDDAAAEYLRAVAGRKLPQVAAMIEHATLVRQWLEAAARRECPGVEECCLFDGAALPATAS